MTATGGRVAVIGGGITGVAAARALVGHGIAVHLIEGADRPGGCIRTSPFAGLPAVDEGPDAFLVRVPGAPWLNSTWSLPPTIPWIST